ncbi:hypothetical protein NIES2119_09390 [[Phormidium ambiguum] IAM M-71]|uniref:Uncharacterized protein n=1 Tax=[Phormidium ambiguum] IAM M-71 TaxID=454136 RepID=A0A1U7IN72_9CYAN|nr:hypothetical protein [Phormidium ambiguum]OKH38791.1 hypothetical protein NIES2119_09390 [Phormidium ambiguum IAM M-71]
MNRIFLVLLTRPTLLGSILSLFVTINPAQASEIITQTSASNQQDLVCTPSVHTTKLVCVKKASLPIAIVTPNNGQPGEDNTPILDFTEEESESAVALFGCDCPACIRSLRQLRGQTT